MAKIQRISVTNLKAISELAIDFNGCTAIITGGNNKGKSTFLRGIIDRIRGQKPELIVRQGEKEGHGTIELTTGEKFIWDFNIDGQDKLTFVTKEGYKTKVTKEIATRFFPPSFDIDKFLNSPPKDQSKQLQKIVGIDFTEIDNRYKLAYDDRYEKNKEAERYHVKLTEMMECPKVDFVDLTELQAKKEAERARLNELYKTNKAHNDKLRNEWTEKKDAITTECNVFNSAQTARGDKAAKAQKLAEELGQMGYTGKEVGDWIDSLLKNVAPFKTAADLYPAEPQYITEIADDSHLQALDKQILEASEINARARDYKEYIEYKKSVDEAKQLAYDANVRVVLIEEERQQLIESANMPNGIAFAENGITVDGFTLDKSQISTSKLYCAALRIASMNLGEVEALHFDASFLDKNTLLEIEIWAAEKGFQLLIERADYDAGDIKYELIES